MGRTFMQWLLWQYPIHSERVKEEHGNTIAEFALEQFQKSITLIHNSIGALNRDELHFLPILVLQHYPLVTD